MCDELSGAHLGRLLVGEGTDGEGQRGEPPVDLVEKHTRGLDLMTDSEGIIRGKRGKRDVTNAI